jgi:cysteine synthase A
VGDILPGPRSLPLVEGSAFPWRGTVDATELVGSNDAFRLSMTLSREGIICGPSSGMTLKGLYEFLQKAKDAGTLQDYAEPSTGEISCVFVCCDLPYQYQNAYFDKLGEEDFPPVINQVRFLLSLQSLVLKKYADKADRSTGDVEC